MTVRTFEVGPSGQVCWPRSARRFQLKNSINSGNEEPLHVSGQQKKGFYFGGKLRNKNWEMRCQEGAGRGERGSQVKSKWRRLRARAAGESWTFNSLRWEHLSVTPWNRLEHFVQIGPNFFANFPPFAAESIKSGADSIKSAVDSEKKCKQSLGMTRQFASRWPSKIFQFGGERNWRIMAPLICIQVCPVLAPSRSFSSLRTFHSADFHFVKLENLTCNQSSQRARWNWTTFHGGRVE